MTASPTTRSVHLFEGGLFANFNNVLNNLKVAAEKPEIVSVRVDWIVLPGLDFFYAPLGANAWELFFEPLAFPAAPGRIKRAPVFPENMITNIFAYRLYKFDRTWRKLYNELYRQHIRPLPFLTQRVDEIVARSFAGHRVIGAHVRNPGHSAENIFDIPPTRDFIEKARELMGDDPEARVFLATDTAAVASEFRSAFGERLIMQPGVERSQNDGQVHLQRTVGSVDFGAQVIVDVLLLSRCDALLHVTSNVATAAGYINPDIPMIYCESPARRRIGTVIAWLMGSRRVRRRLLNWRLRRRDWRT